MLAPASAMAQDDPTGQYVEQIPSGGKPSSNDATQNGSDAGDTGPGTGSGSTGTQPGATPGSPDTSGEAAPSAGGTGGTGDSDGDASTPTSPGATTTVPDPASQEFAAGDSWSSAIWIAVLTLIPFLVALGVLILRRVQRRESL
jgi:hypothetical protein